MKETRIAIFNEKKERLFYFYLKNRLLNVITTEHTDLISEKCWKLGRQLSTADRGRWSTFSPLPSAFPPFCSISIFLSRRWCGEFTQDTSFWELLRVLFYGFFVIPFVGFLLAYFPDSLRPGFYLRLYDYEFRLRKARDAEEETEERSRKSLWHRGAIVFFSFHCLCKAFAIFRSNFLWTFFY